MIKELYAIKDIVSGEFSNPMPFTNEASAKRYFINNVCDENKKIAGDLMLFYVGSYDTELGEIHITRDHSMPCYIMGGANE